MRTSQGPPRRVVALAILIIVLTLILWGSSYQRSSSNPSSDRDALPVTVNDAEVDRVALKGHAIAPKLGNETAKAELGRAAWKLFHTMMARFPDEPTADERSALKSYVHLFQRLYPCGECAEHFGVLLEKFPPQVASRSVAAAWACHVHNEVNKSLNKELFDCANIGDFYDCGCADGEPDEGAKTQDSKTSDRPINDAEAKARSKDSSVQDRSTHKHHPKDVV